ncbi:MAG: hypothetical protein K2H23_07040, partial [Oscillospiraceae bacterium]|nr:hypothetical protein [Oscillospiraceae bacterium]
MQRKSKQRDVRATERPAAFSRRAHLLTTVLWGRRWYPSLRSGTCALRGGKRLLRKPCGQCRKISKRTVIIIAIYHFEAKIISRGEGRSAVAAAAYMSCDKIYNDYDGIQ